MKKKEEINTQVQSLVQLVSSKSFLTDFQKENYNILIKYYGGPAENFANDYDILKNKYDNLAANSPNKLAYKAKMDKAESDLKPNQERLDQIKTEIDNMQTILNILNQINQDNQEIKTKLENLKTSGAGTSVDLSKLATKEDLDQIKTSIDEAETSGNSEITNLKTKLDNLKFPTVDLNATNTKIDEVKTKLAELIDKLNVDFSPLTNQLGILQTSINKIPITTTDLVPTNTKLDNLSGILNNLNKVQEAAQNKKIVDKLFKNSKAIQDYNKTSPIFTMSSSEWKDKVKANPTQTCMLLKQDPKTGLWGILYYYPSKGIRYMSANLDHDREAQAAESWVKSQGITDKVFDKTALDYQMNKDNSQKYSLLWSIGELEIAGVGFAKGNAEWDDIKDPNKWVRKYEDLEAEYNQYLFELSPSEANNCPCDIKGLTNQIDGVSKLLLNVPDIKAAQQKAVVEAFLKGNKNANEYDKKKGNKSPTITADPATFYKGIIEEKDKHHLLLRQDVTSSLWGVVFTNKSFQNDVYYFSPNTSRDNEAEGLKNWLKVVNTGRTFNNYSPDYTGKYKNTDQRFSLGWSLAYIAILTEKWNQGNEDYSDWDALKDDSKWKSVGEAELKKYDDTQLMAQIEIKGN